MFYHQLIEITLLRIFAILCQLVLNKFRQVCSKYSIKLMKTMAQELRKGLPVIKVKQ